MLRSVAALLFVVLAPVLLASGCGGSSTPPTSESVATTTAVLTKEQAAELYESLVAPRNDAIDKMKAAKGTGDDEAFIEAWRDYELAIANQVESLRSANWPREAKPAMLALAQGVEGELPTVRLITGEESLEAAMNRWEGMDGEIDAYGVELQPVVDAARRAVGLEELFPAEPDTSTVTAAAPNPCQDELDMLNRYSRSTHPQEKADSQWLYRECLFKNGKGPDPGPLPD